MTTQETTIGKYIARFRQEKPRPREERQSDTRTQQQLQQQSEFWWTQPRDRGRHRNENGGAESKRDGGDATRASVATESKTMAAAVLDWEVELLSDLSASGISMGGSSGDGMSSPVSRPPPSSVSSSSSSSSHAAPTPTKIPVHEPEATRGDVLSMGRWSREEIEDLALVDDGFVVVADYEEKQEEENHDMDMMASSLEDPEIVIQRIRRRLGFQPSAQQQSLNTGLSLSSASSPHRDEQLEIAELLLSSVDSDAAGLSFAPGGSRSHKSEGISSLAFQASSSSSLEDQDSVVQASPVSEKKRVEDHDTKSHESEQEMRIVRHGGDINASETNDSPATMEDEGTDRQVASNEQDGSENHNEVGAEIQDEPNKKETHEDDSEKEEIQSNAVVSSQEQVDFQDPTPCLSPTGPATVRNINSKTPSTRKKPATANDDQREKPSPRLPPLSPARSPMFKFALTPTSSAAASPRHSSQSEPEITAETSQTLDSLLSFVVQSWGENDSFFGGSDEGCLGAQRPVTSGDKEVLVEKELDSEIKAEPSSELLSDEPSPSAQDHNCDGEELEKHQETEEEDQLQQQLEQEARHASDPIVCMLRQRITVFQEALVRLEEKHDGHLDDHAS